VVAGDNFDVSFVHIEFDGILNNMEQYLFVEGPVAANPTRNQVCLSHLDSEALLLKRMEERGHEVSQHLAHWSRHRLERATHLIDVDACV